MLRVSAESGCPEGSQSVRYDFSSDLSVNGFWCFRGGDAGTPALFNVKWRPATWRCAWKQEGGVGWGLLTWSLNSHLWAERIPSAGCSWFELLFPDTSAPASSSPRQERESWCPSSKPETTQTSTKGDRAVSLIGSQSSWSHKVSVIHSLDFCFEEFVRLRFQKSLISVQNVKTRLIKPESV